jgi:hypothetical protein
LIGLSFSTRSDLLLPEAARLEAAWKQERCDTDFSSRYIADRPLLAWMLGKAPSPTPDWTGPAGRPVYPLFEWLAFVVAASGRDWHSARIFGALLKLWRSPQPHAEQAGVRLKRTSFTERATTPGRIPPRPK